MRRYGSLFFTILLALLLTSAFVPPVTAEMATPAENEPVAHVLSTTSTGVTFEVSVPWEQLSVEPVTADGREYVRIALPGWLETTKAGAPMLPLDVEQIGAPFGANVT